jgi:hypothetical protein
VIRDSRFHRWCAAKRFVYAAEIVKREPARDSRPVVLPLLGESIREPRESPVTHARAQIAALNNRGANALGIRLSEDWDHLHGSNLSGAVSSFAFAGSAIDLNEFGVAADSIMERVGNR